MDKKGWRYDQSEKKCQVTNIVSTDCNDKNLWNNIADEILCVRACEGEDASDALRANNILKGVKMHSG